MSPDPQDKEHTLQDGPKPDAPKIDNLMPQEMALKAEQIGEAKTGLDAMRLFALAALAGAFIGFGAMFATVTAAGAAEFLPYGVVRLLSGLAFSLGLILVIIGGADLCRRAIWLWQRPGRRGGAGGGGDQNITRLRPGVGAWHLM